MDNPTLTNVFNPKIVDVSPIACVLHKLIRYNLLPRLGGGADFTYQDLVVAAMIIKCVPFNFAQMMLLHMMSCIRQTKKCLPYSASLTKLFQHFNISFENELSVPISESIDSGNLKLSRLSLVDGQFIRIVSESPVPPVIPPAASLQSNPSSPEVVDLLQTILRNQQTIQSDISDIKIRLTALEKGKLPIRSDDVQNVVNRVEDEFIDLQAGFEMHTTAMVAALERKMNRNACQLSHEVKFVSNQVGQLAEFSASRMNDVAQRLHFQRRYSPVTEWPHCNWMAEYVGDFLDLPLPDASFIPRPPRYANELTMEERAQRRAHRPYFTRRADNNAHIVDLD